MGKVFVIPEMNMGPSHVVEWMEQPRKQRRQRNYMAAGQVSGEATELTREDCRSV